MNFQDIETFIDLVKNPKAYEAKLAELKAYDASIKANIALSNDIADIKKAKELAANALQQATAKFEAADEQAAKIVADASVVYNKRFAELAEKERKAEEAVAAKKAMELSVTQRNLELTRLEKELAKAQVALETEKVQVAEKQKDLDKRLEKLKSVMG